MTTETTSAEPDEWNLPDHWSDAVRDLFAEVLDERPDLSGADLASLEQACHLASAADALGEVARAAGYVTTGSTGQLVAHPAQVESRLARTSAATILARLSPSRAVKFTERGRRAARSRHGATS